MTPRNPDRPASRAGWELTRYRPIRALLARRSLNWMAMTVALAGLLLAILAGVLGTAAGSANFGIVFVWIVWWGGGEQASHAYVLAPESVLPEQIRQAPPAVREAYRFAIANRETLQYIPCYCGCGAEHASNYGCYVKEVRPDGSYLFDYMSLG